MIRHVVLFKFRQTAQLQTVAGIERGFAQLPSQIPGITGFEWGLNQSPEGLNDGYTHCFIVTFVDAPARDAYLTHPAHTAFVNMLDPLLEKALVVDYATR